MALPDDDSVQAGELALGLLEGEARAAALRRTLAEPAFAADVEQWRARLAGMFDEAGAVPPPAALEERVMAVADARGTGTVRGIGGVAPIWRTLAAVSMLVAACLLLALFLRPAPLPIGTPQPAPAAPAPAPLLAAMTRTDGGQPFAALYDRGRGTLRLVGAGRWPAGRSAELWVIAGKAPPVSLGVLDGGNRVTLAMTRLPPVLPGQTLAISIEPPGGSPTGAPTGPVVATGELHAG